MTQQPMRPATIAAPITTANSAANERFALSTRVSTSLPLEQPLEPTPHLRIRAGLRQEVRDRLLAEIAHHVMHRDGRRVLRDRLVGEATTGLTPNEDALLGQA